MGGQRRPSVSGAEQDEQAVAWTAACDSALVAEPASRKLIAVLDTGAISALAPVNERNRARLRALREMVDELRMPAVVLAEGVLSGHPGRDFHVRRLLDSVDIDAVDEDLAYLAGNLRTEVLRARTSAEPSGVDAIVVAHADTTAVRGDVMIITSDDDDITTLALHATNVGRLSIQAV